MIDIRYPNITAKTEKEKIEQIHRYLYYLADQLNYALPLLESNVSHDTDTNQNRANKDVNK